MAVDKDANGKISAPEALAFWEEKAKTMDQGELQKKLDKFNAKTLNEAVERGFKKVDKDADGAVTPDGEWWLRNSITNKHEYHFRTESLSAKLTGINPVGHQIANSLKLNYLRN